MGDDVNDWNAIRPTPAPLEESLFSIDEEAFEFMKMQTGIEDPEELKKHIMAVQAEAYAVRPYPCIRRFAFIGLKLGRLPAYDQLLALGKDRSDAIFLDIGCCFGNDIRKAVSDGYPIENCIGSDLRAEFWEKGHDLFKTNQETFPVPFIAGDAFDAAHLAPVDPFYTTPNTPKPQLSTLTSLNPLRGHVSAIHASAFFHLFDEPQQLYLAKALAGLLSPEPGSIILGSHGGLPEKGMRPSAFRKAPMFCHSPQTWAALWDGEVFRKGTVKVEVVLEEQVRKDKSPAYLGQKFYLLVWSVTRL